VSEDGRYLIIHVDEGTKPQNLVFYQDLKAAPGKTIEINRTFDAEYRFLDNRGSKLFFRSTNVAPKGRVISIDVSAGNTITEIIPEKKSVLHQAVMLDDSLCLNYQEDVVTHLYTSSLSGKNVREVKLPGKGTAEWAEDGPKRGERFYWFSSFTQPSSLYSLDSSSLRAVAFGDSKLPLDPNAFETRQIFYSSKDGTKIPMFLTGRKGFHANAETPCLLWGYGGFNISITPQYSPLFLQWVEMGGVVAVANLRGGGEYGEAWHQSGMKLKKQNVFDDFISAAEWLIANQYTSKEKLAIYGQSNGGLLIGAVVNQRPDLFGGAIAGVGVMDMLRFNRFTVGDGWTSDYGSPENPAEFKAIRAYSPLHNILQGVHYPPVLVLTADHDDRVVPGHSFKYTAALQHAQGGRAPILIRIETGAGHGGGKPISKQVDEAAAIIGFLEKALGMMQSVS
jgi:prolyl oligopeptidase